MLEEKLKAAMAFAEPASKLDQEQRLPARRFPKMVGRRHD
jgi:hypothetical protein